MSEIPSSQAIAAPSSRPVFDNYDLFAEALDRLQADANLLADAGFAVKERPQLTLVPRDEAEEPCDAEKVPIAAQVEDEGAFDDSTSLLDPDEHGAPWLEPDGAADDAPDFQPVVTATEPAEMPAVSESFDLEDDGEILLSEDEFVGHDHSAVEDVVLSNPLATKQLVAATIVPDEIDIVEESAVTREVSAMAASAPLVSPAAAGAAPRRIGSGKLATPRYHWKPGDPFGGVEDEASRFRWEVMLTTASVTAGCGMGCIWLLRTILA
jgi:hypothetical protein